jgi:hypothetical protein
MVMTNNNRSFLSDFIIFHSLLYAARRIAKNALRDSTRISTSLHFVKNTRNITNEV